MPNSTFDECASNAAGGGPGRLQQFVPTRDAAAFGHHQAVRKHSFPGNRWPTGDITGVGGAQPRHNRIGTCKSSAVAILRLAPDDKRKEEGGRDKSRPYKNNSGRRPLPGARNLFDEPRVTSCHSLFTTQGDFRRPLVYRGAASVTGRRTNAARG